MVKSNKLPYRVTPIKDTNLVTITLSGNLTLDSINTIKLMLMQNLDKYQGFKLKLEDIENIDLGIIQLLYSFKLSAEQKSKSISLEFSLLEDHKQLLEHAGFAVLINDKQ